MLEAAKEQVAAAARRIAEAGLVTGTTGNVSVRDGDLIAISRAGSALRDLTPELVLVVDRAGTVLEGQGEPSTEWRVHVGIYRLHPEAGGVVHAHGPLSVAMADRTSELVLDTDADIAVGGRVRVAGRAAFGSERLARLALEALEGRRAALLAGHGTVAWDRTVRGALEITELLERACGESLLPRA